MIIRILLFLNIFATSYSSAACLTDIAAFGLSSNSIAYTAEQSNANTATLASEFAYDAKLSWIIFCPEKGYEIRPFLRYRNYSFNNTASQSKWGGVPDKIGLFSIGVEARKPITLLDHDIEVPIIVEIRQEIGFGVSSTDSSIYKEEYLNLKVMAGAHYHIWGEGKRDITGVTKLGLMLGMDEQSSLGFIYGVSFEYYQKIGKKMSLELDLYFDRYNQDYGSLTMTRSELGLRTNIVFRF